METLGYTVNFETISKEDLNLKLKHFYAETKPKNPEKRATKMTDQHASVYHKNTLKNVRSALSRHLRDLNRNIDIVRDSEFRESNKMLDSTLKMMVRTGLSRPTQHKEIIEMDDLKKISDYIYQESSTPVILRLRVWYALAIHFVSRGLEFHQQLSLNSFDFCRDSEGDEYAVINHETQQKNVQGGVTSDEAPTDKHMFAMPGSKTCPVSSLRLFIQKTESGAKSLFNRCVKDIMITSNVESVETWYMDQPLTKRTYSTFMGDICKNSKCSKVYTAHCLRATAIQAMNDAGHELRHIMFMTGHKSESSIRSYNRHCSESKRNPCLLRYPE